MYPQRLDDVGAPSGSGCLSKRYFVFFGPIKA